MAKTKPEPLPAPTYGALRPQVIDFLRQLLVKGHKSEQPILVFQHEGRPHLRYFCVRCKSPLIIPGEGPFEVPFCALPGHAQGGA